MHRLEFREQSNKLIKYRVTRGSFYAISHGGLLRRGNTQKWTVCRDDKEATEETYFHLLFQTFLITTGASLPNASPLFAKFGSAVDPPLEAFWFFF